jgi:hypothetical protein
MFYEGVHTQSDHRGICLAGTGVTLEQLYQTTQNKVWNVTTKWAGDTSGLTASNGIGAFVSPDTNFKYIFI